MQQRKGETREDFLRRRREYYQANIERERARARKWDSEHRDKRMAYDVAHRKEAAEYYQSHKKKALDRARARRERFPTHSTWCGIMKRCGMWKCARDFEMKGYRDRGITVCEEWRKLEVFNAWAISHGWRKGLQIDRIDGTKGYCPENCRIVDCKTNIRNRRTTVRVELDGELMTIVEAMEKLGNPYNLYYGTVYSRIKKGIDTRTAILTDKKIVK